MPKKFETGRVRLVPSALKPLPMVIGFTGTREGMSKGQQTQLWKLMGKATEAHHGDCIGADEQFHEVCAELEIPIIIFPPDDDKLRAYCTSGNIIRIHPELPYLIRNKLIVETCEILIACPKERNEPPPQRGQGTWSTVRYARRIGRRMRILWPEAKVWD